MTAINYLQVHNMCTITEQLILVTLVCEILVVLWDDENAKIASSLCEAALCGAAVITDVMSVMGPVMTGLTYTITVSFVIKLTVMAIKLSAIVKYRRLISRCKRACRQNKQTLSAEDICLICQQYCRQVRQKKLYP